MAEPYLRAGSVVVVVVAAAVAVVDASSSAASVASAAYRLEKFRARRITDCQGLHGLWSF